ncbi:MAG: spore maturation protein [Clostridia bacterium]
MTDMIVPLVILFVIVLGIWRRVPVYETFLIGARKGLYTAVDVLPCLIAMLTFIALLIRSGVMESLAHACAPILELVGIPKGVLPMLLIRPFSGSAALAMLEQTMAQFGPDSIEGRTASTLMGSSETIFYTVSLYLAAAGVKRARYAVPAALLAWIVGGIAAAFVCRFL